MTTLNGNWNFIVDPYETGSRPEKELKDFRKMKLNTGETKTIRFIIDKEKQSFYIQQLQWVAEPGDFELMIGAFAEDIKLRAGFELKVK